MKCSHFLARVLGAYQRSASGALFKRSARMTNKEAIVSFTFDDFPKSALTTGGGILEKFECRGTFYASLGLMGQKTATGLIFNENDLHRLVEIGHELGCHTFGHCDAWETSPGRFRHSLEENRCALKKFLPSYPLNVFSYPKSPPRPANKRCAGACFSSCRGGGQKINEQVVDFHYLRAFFLEQSRENIAEVAKIIQSNLETRGWLILATHDVSETPTPFGCVPDFFEEVVRLSVESGARILPVGEASQLVVE